MRVAVTVLAISWARHSVRSLNKFRNLATRAARPTSPLQSRGRSECAAVVSAFVPGRDRSKGPSKAPTDRADIPPGQGQFRNQTGDRREGTALHQTREEDDGTVTAAAGECRGLPMVAEIIKRHRASQPPGREALQSGASPKRTYTAHGGYGWNIRRLGGGAQCQTFTGTAPPCAASGRDRGIPIRRTPSEIHPVFAVERPSGRAHVDVAEAEIIGQG